MKRLTRSIGIALVLISLLSACANPIGSRNAAQSNQPPAAVKPLQDGPSSPNGFQPDTQADALDHALTDLENQLRSTDTLDDLR